MVSVEGMQSGQRDHDRLAPVAGPLPGSAQTLGHPCQPLFTHRRQHYRVLGEMKDEIALHLHPAGQR